MDSLADSRNTLRSLQGSDESNSKIKIEQQQLRQGNSPAELLLPL
jgi:hypothetical protein